MKRKWAITLIGAFTCMLLVGCVESKNSTKEPSSMAVISDKKGDSKNEPSTTITSEKEPASTIAKEPETESQESNNGWPDVSTYELVTFEDGSQRYISSVDVEEIEQIVAEEGFPQSWWDIMEALNTKSYNITGFWCNCGQGASFLCGTDSTDDIVKTQQFLDELVATYKYTVLQKSAN